MILIIFLSIIFLLLIISLAIMAWGYKISFYVSNHYKKTITPYHTPDNEQCRQNEKYINSLVAKMETVPFEEVSIKAYDGLKLYGRLYVQDKSAPIDICFHGWKGTAIRDFAGGGKIGIDSGHNLLLVDQRGQNKSQGHTMTFGVKERFDVVSWVNFVIERFGNDCQIFTMGVSMGAATVLMAAGLNLPENVKGIIADCPYSSPRAIMKKVCVEDMHMNDTFLHPFVSGAALIFGHFKIDSVSAVESVKNCNIPILIIHGTKDGFVPVEMSGEIQAANPKIQRELFEGADHGLSYVIDTPRYEKLVQDFYKKCIS